MPHDIDCSTGKPAIAYVGEPPWHGLGERLAEGETIEVWIKAARLDWELKMLPVHYLIDGTLRGMDDRFVLARSDSGAALSVVSGDYHIVQPKEVLEFYRDLVASFHYFATRLMVIPRRLATSGSCDELEAPPKFSQPAITF